MGRGGAGRGGAGRGGAGSGPANGHRRRYLAEFDAPASLTDTVYAMGWESG
ncbi:hypothetical protein AB4114_12215 [Paenibacillus sp. 2RAB27]|uniref:hypothetical protein n=1 Tax=Paenibacillus sp. 2RAB27 TaxID=3232991 RepID=UPI003F9AB110